MRHIYITQAWLAYSILLFVLDARVGCADSLARRSTRPKATQVLPRFGMAGYSTATSNRDYTLPITGVGMFRYAGVSSECSLCNAIPSGCSEGGSERHQHRHRHRRRRGQRDANPCNRARADFD